MHIHFVCRGNAYRSRLAEAYLRSKQLPGLSVSSSGIEAAAHAPTYNGPISWVAQRILQRNGLVPFMTLQPTQTTLALLHAADFVVFMDEDHSAFAREQLGYTGKRFQIWYIPDILISASDASQCDDDAAMIQVSEATYRSIQAKCEELITHLGTSHQP